MAYSRRRGRRRGIRRRRGRRRRSRNPRKSLAQNRRVGRRM